MKVRARAIVVIFCVVSVAAVRSAASKPRNFETSKPPTDAATIERELLLLVNRERTQRGLQPLEENAQLHQAAQQQVEMIAKNQKLSHRFPGQPSMSERIAATGVHFDAAGENAAEVGDTGDAAHDAAEAHTTLMLSPPHRENLLNPKFNAAGIAVASSGGHLWVVQDFARAYADVSVTEVESRALRALNQLRAAHRLQPIELTEQPGLRQVACRDNVSANSVLSQFSRANFALVYTVWHVDDWPKERTEAATDPSYHSAAIAACPLEQSHGEFRVVVLFFPERNPA